MILTFDFFLCINKNNAWCLVKVDPLLLDFISLVPYYFFWTHLDLPTTLYWESLFLPRLINNCLRRRGNIKRNNLNILFSVVDTSGLLGLFLCANYLPVLYHLFELRWGIVGIKITRANIWFFSANLIKNNRKTRNLSACIY